MGWLDLAIKSQASPQRQLSRQSLIANNRQNLAFGYSSAQMMRHLDSDVFERFETSEDENFSRPVSWNQPRFLMETRPSATLQTAISPIYGPQRVQRSAPVALTANTAKQLFWNNEGVMYALNIRTFNAHDLNHNGKIDLKSDEMGTFLSAVDRLDELKRLGVNMIHMLPVTKPGQAKHFGNASSLYSAASLQELNPQLRDPRSPMSLIEQARYFVQEAHKRGISVIADIPSCVSQEFADKYPDLIERDETGKMVRPPEWIDILMMKKDSPELRKHYQGFFDLMGRQVGVDGFRADVARARSHEFWQHFIGQFPDKLWLAESYGEEAAPVSNIPRDNPQGLMRDGFDSVYGQFHIFPQMRNADEYMRYLTNSYGMLQRSGAHKSFIGSFYTHDDVSLMGVGGPLLYFLSAGLMCSQPWTNPYILDGFTTGDPGELDIYNFNSAPVGHHPEIGRFVKSMLTLYNDTRSGVSNQGSPSQTNTAGIGDILTRGWFIPIPVQTKDRENQVIAFARHLNGRTVLVVANKDLNARHTGSLKIPGLQPDGCSTNLAPEYGKQSLFGVHSNEMQVDLGPGRFHLFEIQTPNILEEPSLKAYPGVIPAAVNNIVPTHGRLNNRNFSEALF